MAKSDNDWKDNSWKDSDRKDSDRKDSDRKLVTEFREGSIIAEVYEKYDVNTERVFFDIKFVREYIVKGGERRRGPFIQQRDLRDIIIADVKAMKFISDTHRDMRKNTEFVEEGREYSD